jgi:lysophospholipase L1-like esterase
MANFIAKYGGYADALNGGCMKIFTGTQPASADAAETGTLLCTITDNSQARTAEVLATATVTLTGGASGSVNTVTVGGNDILGGAVPFNSTLSQTASDVAAQINANNIEPGFTANAVGAVITLTPLPGQGANINGTAVSATLTTITASYVNFSGGVTAVNGLKFSAAAAGVISKRSGQTWSGVNAAAGLAGWFRFYGSVADAGALDTTGTKLRVDGAVATAGAELSLNNTNFAVSVPTVIQSGTGTVPTSA